MKSDLPREILHLLIKKLNKPFYIIVIICLYKAIDLFNIIEAKEILFWLCVFFICLVILKDTISKCFKAACRTLIAVEKEKTERIRIEKELNNKNFVDQEGVKIYKFNQK